jgi:hypothetical protein
MAALLKMLFPENSSQPWMAIKPGSGSGSSSGAGSGSGSGISSGSSSGGGSGSGSGGGSGGGSGSGSGTGSGSGSGLGSDSDSSSNSGSLLTVTAVSKEADMSLVFDSLDADNDHDGTGRCVVVSPDFSEESIRHATKIVGLKVAVHSIFHGPFSLVSGTQLFIVFVFANQSDVNCFCHSDGSVSCHKTRQAQALV